MKLFDLASADLAPSSDDAIADSPVEFGTADAIPPVDDLPKDGGSIVITFAKFSDGRGFTHARRLRGEFGFTGPIIAAEHIIPDQADFLRRCGFSHVVIIDDAKVPQWKYALSIIPTRFQTILDSTHSRCLSQPN